MNATAKKMDLKSLRSEINLLRKSLLNFRFQKSTGQIKKTRRKIAFLKNAIGEQKGNKNA